MDVMEAQSELRRLLERQGEIRRAMRQPGGIRITVERELFVDLSAFTNLGVAVLPSGGAVRASKSAAIPTTAYSIRLMNVSRPV